jgi:glycosyltransferase involved in cell wall biosynthesis
LFSLSIGELVQDGKNGIIFGNASELAQALLKWFDGNGFRENVAGSYHQLCRMHAARFATRNWHTNWKEIALPVIRSS